VAEFLAFTTGGGGMCDDTYEPPQPSVDLGAGIPMVVCAYGFVSGEAINLVLRGPDGWEKEDAPVANELGAALWEIDDLPVPVEGDYVLEATQGQVRINEAKSVMFDDLVAGVVPQEIANGDTARLVVAGGPSDTDVSVYLYRAEEPVYRFAAELGELHLDASGQGSFALTPRVGDPPGTYLIEVPWPPGKELGNGPTFQVRRAAAEALAYLSNGIRDDVGGCGPREGDLPALAVAGVECHRLGSDLVDSVGFYLFNDRVGLLDAYYARLAQQDVEPDSGNCEAGQPGDRAWSDDEFGRVGCFVNDQGFANLRWTLASGPIYVGVLGNSNDIVALMDWSSGSSPGTNLWIQP
jgi:hypothetical protein